MKELNIWLHEKFSYKNCDENEKQKKSVENSFSPWFRVNVKAKSVQQILFKRKKKKQFWFQLLFSMVFSLLQRLIFGHINWLQEDKFAVSYNNCCKSLELLKLYIYRWIRTVYRINNRKIFKSVCCFEEYFCNIIIISIFSFHRTLDF